MVSNLTVSVFRKVDQEFISDMPKMEGFWLLALRQFRFASQRDGWHFPKLILCVCRVFLRDLHGKFGNRSLYYQIHLVPSLAWAFDKMLAYSLTTWAWTTIFQSGYTCYDLTCNK